MYKDNFSPMENFAADFIKRVNCISVYQMEYILYKMYGANPKVSNYMLHNFTGLGICHFDKDYKCIVAGASLKNRLHTFERKTIIAISVALKTITDPNDYKTMYAPNYGEDLRFMANGKSYGVFVSSEDNISALLFYQKQFDDFIKKACKNKKVKEEDMINAYSKILITFPLKTDVKTALNNVEATNLTMPHALCFLSGENIYEKIDVKVLEAAS